jgi:hypothetical protein
MIGRGSGRAQKRKIRRRDRSAKPETVAILLLALSKIPWDVINSFLLLSHSTPAGSHVEVDGADVRILHPRCSQLAIIRPPSTGISAFAHKPQTVRVLRPFRLWLWSETLFCHLPKRTFTSYRWGPGEGGSAGRAPRDGGNGPHSRCFGFRWERDRGAVVTLMTAGRPCAPASSVAPAKAPLTRGFCFLGVVTTLLCADRHIRNRPWSLACHHQAGLGGHPHPPDPPFAKARSLRLRQQLQRPRAH